MNAKIYYWHNVLAYKLLIELSCHYSILNYIFIVINDINNDTFAIEIRFNYPTLIVHLINLN